MTDVLCCVKDLQRSGRSDRMELLVLFLVTPGSPVCWQDVSVFTGRAGYPTVQQMWSSLGCWPYAQKHPTTVSHDQWSVMSTCSEPPIFPLRSRRASFPFSLAGSSRTSLSSEGSRSLVVSYKCQQTTSAGIFGKKTKELYEGQFQRYQKHSFQSNNIRIYLKQKPLISQSHNPIVTVGESRGNR